MSRDDALPTAPELAAHGLQLLTGAELPPAVREIPSSPPWLVLSGTAPADSDLRVAVVGARRATALARREAFRLGQELAAAGVQVVSGLARGVDRAVLEGALAGAGRPGAVLGNGLPDIYPPEHTPLAERLSGSGGFVLSEFPLFTGPRRSRFPRRNRLISALGMVTVVLQAGLASGSLITAGWALDQGRDVLVFPGPTDTPAFAGSHRLLRDGAGLVTCAGDILEELAQLPGTRSARLGGRRTDDAAMS